MSYPPTANFDEAAVPAYPAPILEGGREDWLKAFAREIYGPVPPPPDEIELLARTPTGLGGERLVLRLSGGGRRHEVDAALWLPPGADGPVPVVVGLSFLGPAGLLADESFPLDPGAVVFGVPEAGLVDGRLADQIRGLHGHRWPLPLILGAGYGLLVSCYGSWTPDDPAHWRGRGVWPLLDLDRADRPPGAISLWAWAFRRLVDLVGLLPELASGRIAIAGHSRLGKAALWAAAGDPRISAVLANNAGCFGTSLSRRRFGETPKLLAERFPHWPGPLVAEALAAGREPPIDQHALIAAVAPRRVYVASGADDAWADRKGEYEALAAALPAWGLGPWPGWDEVARPGAARTDGPVGWHLRPGGHNLTPWDWRRFLGFLRATDMSGARSPAAGRVS